MFTGTGDPSNVDQDFEQCQNQDDPDTVNKTPATYTDLTFVVDQTTDPGEMLRQKEMIAYEIAPATAVQLLFSTQIWFNVSNQPTEHSQMLWTSNLEAVGWKSYPVEMATPSSASMNLPIKLNWLAGSTVLTSVSFKNKLLLLLNYDVWFSKKLKT